MQLQSFMPKHQISKYNLQIKIDEIEFIIIIKQTHLNHQFQENKRILSKTPISSLPQTLSGPKYMNMETKCQTTDSE